MADGKIIQGGGHEELVEQDGLYRSVWNTQVQYYQMIGMKIGEPFTVIGQPSPYGNGMTLRGNTAIAIHSQSKNKEAAWEFLESCFSSRRQEKEHIFGFPIFYSQNGEIVEFYAATQEQVDDIWKLIHEVNTLAEDNDTLLAIIVEETEAYFKGQKSVKEVTDMIQKRAKIYVNE